MEHAIPTTVELTEAVREFLDHEVRAATTGRVQFLARVASNVLAMVERELLLGPEAAAEHRALLARLDVDDDRQLARRIRDGELDDRMDEVVAIMRRQSVARVRVVHPGWLRPGDTATFHVETE